MASHQFTTTLTSIHVDKPLSGYDYSSGIWQFEGNFYVPSGLSRMSIMQVFGGSPSATNLMLRDYDGNLYYYKEKIIESNIYNKWYKVNVIHDVGASKLKVYINRIHKHEASRRSGDQHYLKFGVYTQNNEANYMESHWSSIKLYKNKAPITLVSFCYQEHSDNHSQIWDTLKARVTSSATYGWENGGFCTCLHIPAINASSVLMSHKEV
ncbi:hypothetical protein H5410_022559 [Solanum commersonii]|uniref:Alginate lyase 2 domain-containing protein n=1 Tax=Solanum commersonii TaxID=4109 RepID=A0A9J5ZJG2_SOLCO|nr:hypothetical protein H5410_022559 [Solanum commersonii]